MGRRLLSFEGGNSPKYIDVTLTLSSASEFFKEVADEIIPEIMKKEWNGPGGWNALRDKFLQVAAAMEEPIDVPTAIQEIQDFGKILENFHNQGKITDEGYNELRYLYEYSWSYLQSL